MYWLDTKIRRVAQFRYSYSISCNICVWQITMTTGWLLLLLLVVSSQSVDSQTTAGPNRTCNDGGLRSKLDRMFADQQRQLQEHQTLLDNQQQIFQLMNRLGNGKSLFPIFFARVLAFSLVIRCCNYTQGGSKSGYPFLFYAIISVKVGLHRF